MSGAGTAITTFLAICCASVWSISLTPDEIARLHIHASEWYENNGMILEAFTHAAAANDIERAERLMELKEMPLHLPGVPLTILKWLESLPVSVLNSKPALWWKQAAMMLSNYQTIGVEEKLQAAEAALALKIPPQTEMDEWSRNLVGKIAVARAMLAATLYQAETSLVSREPRHGVSAPQQRGLPFNSHSDYWICPLYPGRPRRGGASLYRSVISRPGCRG